MRWTVLILLPLSTDASMPNVQDVFKGYTIVMSNRLTLVGTLYRIAVVDQSLCLEPYVIPDGTQVSLQTVIDLRLRDAAGAVSVQDQCYRTDGFCVRAVNEESPLCGSFEMIPPLALVQDTVAFYYALQRYPESLTAIESILANQIGPSLVELRCGAPFVQPLGSSLEAHAASFTWNAFLRLWQYASGCPDPDTSYRDIFLGYVSGMSPLNPHDADSRCLRNLISSTLRYLDHSTSPLRPPLRVDDCIPITNDLANTHIVPPATMVGPTVSIPGITGYVTAPVSWINPIWTSSAVCPLIRGNQVACSAQDVWSCASFPGCDTDWSLNVCADVPSGFFSEGGDEAVVTRCDPIPSDQFYIGQAWTNSTCPSRCRDSASLRSSGGTCSPVRDFGYFVDKCGQGSVQYKCNPDDPWQDQILQYPVKGSCDGASLTHLAIHTRLNAESVSFWVRIEASLTSDQVLVSVPGLGEVAVDASSQALYLRSNQKVYGSTAIVHVGQWTHIMLISDISQTRYLWVDGTLTPLIISESQAQMDYAMYTTFGPKFGQQLKIPGMTFFDLLVNNRALEGDFLYTHSRIPEGHFKVQNCIYGSPVSNSCSNGLIRFEDVPTTTTTGKPATSAAPEALVFLENTTTTTEATIILDTTTATFEALVVTELTPSTLTSTQDFPSTTFPMTRAEELSTTTERFTSTAMMTSDMSTSSTTVSSTSTCTSTFVSIQPAYSTASVTHTTATTEPQYTEQSTTTQASTLETSKTSGNTTEADSTTMIPATTLVLFQDSTTPTTATRIVPSESGSQLPYSDARQFASTDRSTLQAITASSVALAGTIVLIIYCFIGLQLQRRRTTRTVSNTRV